MKLVKFDGVLPEIDLSSKKRVKLLWLLDEFISMQTKTVEVIYRPDEYDNIILCYNALSQSAQRSCLPIKVIHRGNNIFMVRTDM